MDQNLGKALFHRFLSNISNVSISFSQLLAGEFHQCHRKLSIGFHQVKQYVGGNVTKGSFLQDLSGGAGRFIAYHRTVTDQIGRFCKSYNLFLSVEACFIYLYNSGMNTIESLHSTAFAVDNRTSFMGFCYLIERDILKLLFAQVAKQGMCSNGAGTTATIQGIFIHIKRLIA